MKLIKPILYIAAAAIITYIASVYIEDHPKLQNAIPLLFILALYVRYETKFENISKDLLTAEEQIEALSNGEWTIDTRFRGNPYEA